MHAVLFVFGSLFSTRIIHTAATLCT